MPFSLVVLRYTTPEGQEKKVKLEKKLPLAKMATMPGVYQINYDAWLFDMNKALLTYSDLISGAGLVGLPLVSLVVDPSAAIQSGSDGKLTHFLSGGD